MTGSGPRKSVVAAADCVDEHGSGGNRIHSDAAGRKSTGCECASYESTGRESTSHSRSGRGCRSWRSLGRTAAAAAVWLVTLGGCAHDEILPPLPYSVYHDPAFVPTECRRLVLLPLENESPFPGAEEELRQVLAQELRQWGAFEVFVPPCDSIPRNAADGGPLSDAALTELAARYQADAFLMGRLTVFHPYRPMRIGASLSLLGVRNATTLAAIDGVWTAPSESVSRARTELLHEPTEMAAADSRTRAASSPRQLMQVLSQDAFQAFQAAPALVLPPDAPTY